MLRLAELLEANREELAALMADAGLVVLVSFISPFRSERRMARSLMKDGEFAIDALESR